MIVGCVAVAEMIYVRSRSKKLISLVVEEIGGKVSSDKTSM